DLAAACAGRGCGAPRSRRDLRRDPRYLTAAAGRGRGRDDRLGRRREGDREARVQAARLGDRVPADPPPRRVERPEVGTIAAAVAGRPIEKLEPKPPASATVYQQILPSLVEIEA